MDLESEEIVFEDEYLIGQYGTCLDVIANGTKIVHAGSEKISVFDIIGKIVVSNFVKNVKDVFLKFHYSIFSEDFDT